MPAMCSSMVSRSSDSPSGSPCDHAIPELVVAMAGKPSASRMRADPASQALGSTKPGPWWRVRRRTALPGRGVTVPYGWVGTSAQYWGGGTEDSHGRLVRCAAAPVPGRADCPCRAATASAHDQRRRSLHITLDGQSPVVHETAWTAPGVVLVADVELGEEVSVWYGAVLRADCDAIRIGARSNLQDNVVVHTDAGFPVHVGTGVSVGHGAVLPGCTGEGDVRVGVGASILHGARIGARAALAAGARGPAH